MSEIEPEVRQFADVLPEPTLLVSGNGQIVFANGACAALFGVDRTSLIGRLLQEFTATPSDAVETYLKLCGRSKQLLPGSLRIHGKSGSCVTVRCDGAVLSSNGQGERAIFVRCRPKAEATDHFVLLNQKIAALSREILERKKAELERDELLKGERAARMEAERIGRLKDEFLSTLSHELRTPLNAILGWTALLETEELPPTAVEGVEVIARNARLQKQLIEDLLDMSRIISGKVRLDVQRVELAQIINAAVASMRPAADAKGIRIQLALDPIAGPVKGDPGRLQQVVWNLLSNAVKFTPKGGRIQVFLERVNSHVEITVADNGIGMSPSFLPNVFERFRQADSSSTRRHGGLGIGLSITKQLVELHGGSIWAKSPGEGQGSTFIVMLPVLLLHEPAVMGATSRVHPTSSPSIAKDHHCVIDLTDLDVLIVDDEKDARDLAQRLLQTCRARVRTAASAAEALQMLMERPPHVLLSDIGMPETDGYDFIRQVRQLPVEQGGRIPAIAVTAFARSEDRTRALIAGYNLHLSKPVEPRELIVSVGTLAGRQA